jgi:D-3-phosphoglycerate dehydrogenase / 2-oxoglutarate reductase
MNIGILEPDGFSNSAKDVLSRLGKVETYKGGDLVRFVKNKSILFVRLNIQINRALIDAAPDLTHICSPTTGLNHIDVDYCRKQHIEIVSLKGEFRFLKTIRATPEHTLGLLLALKRHYKDAFLNTRNSEWNRDSYRGYEIFKSKIGIIGLGRVGALLASFLKPMGAEVGYYDTKRSIKKKGLLRYDSIQALIGSSDTVILCSSYSAETGSIIGETEINAMKGKYFINTARAELTDEDFLAQKAINGHFKGIAVDVILDEQSGRKNLKKWLKAAEVHNVIVTPHIGGATYSSMCRTEEFITEKLIRGIERK